MQQAASSKRKGKTNPVARKKKKKAEQTIVPEIPEESEALDGESEVAWWIRRILLSIERHDYEATAEMLQGFKGADWGKNLEHLREARAGVTLRRISRDQRPELKKAAAVALEVETAIRARIVKRQSVTAL